jgi:hypothetical protein
LDFALAWPSGELVPKRDNPHPLEAAKRRRSGHHADTACNAGDKSSDISTVCANITIDF